MMRRFSKLWRGERGVSLVEFALIAPALCTFLIAIANFGILFFAHSGLEAAVAEGALFANKFPTPDDAAIIARINDRRYGLDAAAITGPTITAGTNADGRRYLDIEMRYQMTMKFVFFNWPAYPIVEKRRVFIYDAPPPGFTFTT